MEYSRLEFSECLCFSLFCRFSSTSNYIYRQQKRRRANRNESRIKWTDAANKKWNDFGLLSRDFLFIFAHVDGSVWSPHTPFRCRPSTVVGHTKCEFYRNENWNVYYEVATLASHYAIKISTRENHDRKNTQTLGVFIHSLSSPRRIKFYLFTSSTHTLRRHTRSSRVRFVANTITWV